jgi:hypothetical protein
MSDKTASVSVPALNSPAETLDELCDQYLPALAAKIWDTCRWMDRDDGWWKVGDFRFLGIAIAPEPDTMLYVQFWSEPEDKVLVEVSSGESSPTSVKYVQKRQRDLIRSLGFEIGGEAKNFRKVVNIRNVAEAEEIARETLRLFFEGFNYRGQWPLELAPGRGARAQQMPVYLSLSPDDLAKMLVGHGYKSTVTTADGGPLLLAKRGRRRFMARFVGQVRENGRFTAVILDALLDPGHPTSDATLATVNAGLPQVTVLRHEGSGMRVSGLLRLEGGVTAAWILSSVEYWFAAVRRCERMLQGDDMRMKPPTRRRPQPHVH